MILSDTIPQLLETIGLTVTRTQTLLSLTSFVLLPLCLLKELKSLAPFSLVGISGMFYTTAAMAVRYFGGAYKEGGKLLESVAEKYQPAFGDKGASAVLHPNTFILVSMLSTGFMAHYLAHKFYRELRNKTIPRFQLVVRVSFLIATVIFCSVASLGFLTFGSSCSGLVLNNYSTKDTLMSLSRVAVAISLLTSYPLAFTGVRDGFLDFYGVPQEKRTNSFLNVLTLGLLSVITVLAFLVRDLRIVLAFAGATWGNALTYLFPTYMFMNLARKTPELKKEVPVVITTGLLGLAMGVVGTVRAIKSL
jgi:amino acid permease